MDRGEASKRKRKSYFRRCAKDGKRPKKDNSVLCPGMRGFFATCNRREVECLRELRNILTTVHSELKPAENTNEQPVDQDDIAKAIEDELREGNVDEAQGESASGATKHKHMFPQVRTNTKNCLFIHVPSSIIKDVSQFALRVFEQIERSKMAIARYTMRLLPISETCHADMESLRNAAKRLVEAHLPAVEQSVSGPDTAATSGTETTKSNSDLDGKSSSDGKPKSFCCMFESRNNDSLPRQQAILEVADVVRAMRSDLVVDYKQPDVVILIEVICNVICLGFAPNYAELRKYNLIEYGRKVISGSCPPPAKATPQPAAANKTETEVETTKASAADLETNVTTAAATVLPTPQDTPVAETASVSTD